MTEAKVNFNFEESYISDKQVKVTNNLGRTAEHLEFVWLDGYFGEVREFDDIANAASGVININNFRRVWTTQIETTDTFTVNGIVYFVPGGAAAAGKLRAGYQADGIPVGICTEINAGVAIEFRPFPQKLAGGDSLNSAEYVVDSDASAGIDITGLIPVGARIVDIIVKATAASAGGTLQLTDTTPAAISNAIVCAVNTTITRAGTLTNEVVDGDGLRIVSNAAADRGIMTILWR